MSALGRKRTFAVQNGMSALPLKADIRSATRYVRFVPIATLMGFRSACGAFWSSTETMSHSQHCWTRAIQLFGWFADYYGASGKIFWLPMLTPKRLRKILRYAPTTGIFRWKVSASSRASVGSIAGAKNGRGYHQIRIGGRPYPASRLAWLYMTGKWPNSEISYLNGKPSDTRWANLRGSNIVAKSQSP